MKATGPAFGEFRRASVADQAAAALRESIRQGAWGDLLPGEHELARRLSISRPTVRAALARLADDGIVAIKKGCRTRLCAMRRKNFAAAPPTVCLVVPASRESHAYSGHPVLMEMRAQLAVQGVGWEEVFDRTLGGRHPETRLASIVNGRHHVCWVLLGAPATIQRWFQQARVPTLVLGSCHEGIALPSVDVNYYAMGWHAGGCLTKNGHRRVAVVLPHRPLAGDLACLHGLTAYVARRDQPVSVAEVTAGPSRAGLLAGLDRLLAKPEPPTAVVCLHVAHVLMVLVHLLRSGRRVPRDISLLCRETHAAVDLGLPELTRYRSPVIKQAHHAVRIAQSMLAGHHITTAPHLIMPAFVAGETLARTIRETAGRALAAGR
ncbi:MAG: transcriptional regulator [Verrucomicrobia bacterium]|nr:transcriptional regulator [Verrucomicrobiota bacterium]